MCKSALLTPGTKKALQWLGPVLGDFPKLCGWFPSCFRQQCLTTCDASCPPPQGRGLQSWNKSQGLEALLGIAGCKPHVCFTCDVSEANIVRGPQSRSPSGRCSLPELPCHVTEGGPIPYFITLSKRCIHRPSASELAPTEPHLLARLP